MAAETIPNWLQRRAATQPDHPAVIAGDQVVTYAELDRRATEAAVRLRRMGVRPDDRVAVLARNGLPFVVVVHGLMRCGAVSVPLHPKLTPGEVVAQLRDCNAAFLLAEEALLGALRGARDAPGSVAMHALREVLEGEAAAKPGEHQPRIRLDAEHSIVYTSGSTGEPRGVRLTYGNHWWSAIGSAMNLGVHEDDRWLACLPFCHVGGLSILLRSVIYGTTVVVHETFDAGCVNRAIDEDGVTIVSVVATMLRRMLAERGDKPYPASLRCVLTGGGPVPASLLEECVRRGVPVVQTYGLTEAASQVTTLAPRDAPRRPGSAGKPLLPTEIAIAGQSEDAGRGMVGEILVRSPTLSPGYTGGRELPRDAAGWFRTGDIGRLDEDGFLYVLGRLDERIVSGGENVHPAEVEGVLESHPAVAEACVVGVPDPEWGNAVVAFVRLHDGVAAGEDELREHARRFLATFKLPRRIRFVPDFPRTAAGKIRRGSMRDAAGESG